MSNTKVIKVTSDNFDGSYMTPEAYQELRLQMSTGDFHSHKAETVEIDDIEESAEIFTLQDIID